MNRAIVLILCLASAGGIAAYTHYSGDAGEQTAVYTVPPRTAEPVTKPLAVPAPKAVETPGDRASLARELQRELKRVGCYSGDINGAWTTSSRMAMKAFTDRVNATLPIDTPDYVLLSLVQGHQDKACGAGCPAGQTSTETSACVPSAVFAKAAKTPADARPDPSAEKSGAAALPTVAAAALAPAAPAAPKPEPKASAPDDRARAVAAPPQEATPPVKNTRPGKRNTPEGGPVPPEGIHQQRPRRSEQRVDSRPPKVVRDVLRALGFK